MAITDYKVSETYAGRDIASLPDRPNEAGMSASLLKARFDQLGKEVIPNYNDLIDFINLNLFSGGTQIGHTHNVDILEDGTTNRLYTNVEKTKLVGIENGAEVNQNAFSNVKVGSTTIPSTTKMDTLELVAGLNITMTVDALTKKISLSATGDLATEAVQSLIVDIGEYYTSLNVEGALQEIGLSLLNKVDKVAGKGLSTEDYTSTEKTKLSGIATGANNYVHPATHLPSIIEQDEGNRFVTDTEKTSWNGKQNTLVSGTNIKTINGNSVLGIGDVELLPKNNPIATGTQTLPNIVTNGIKFPATQVPSSDPNTLDDYEEGAFTPSIRGETTVGTATYTNRQGRYIKIGGVVHFQIYLNWSSLTGTGAMIITGLPFVNGSVLGAVTVAYPNLIALPASGVMTAYINASLIYLTSYPSGGGAISFIQCDAGGEFMLSGTYMI